MTRYVVHIGGLALVVMGEFQLATLLSGFSHARRVEKRDGRWVPIPEAPITLHVEIVPALSVRRAETPPVPRDGNGSEVNA